MPSSDTSPETSPDTSLETSAETVGDASRSGRPAAKGAQFPRIVALVVGVLFAASGVWAMVDPSGFFETTATFPPYNQHFIQDIGAFLGGLGAVLLLAATLPALDALAVALLGVGIGAALHTVSHVVGRDLGGTPSVDIPSQGVVAVLLLAAGVWHHRRLSPR
jgi:hypothetical protein